MNRRDEIARELAKIRSEIPEGVELIIVTKNFPVSDIEILYDLGERNFGENREAEGSLKARSLPSDIIWHYQGEIQSKKIRSILSWADIVHSLDNFDHAEKIERILDELGESLTSEKGFFIQVNLDGPGSERGGVPPEDIDEFLLRFGSQLPILGLMAIAPLKGDPDQAFSRLAQLSQQVQKSLPDARNISAGMSGDFRQALLHGATHLRIGSSILGSRSDAL
jgi:pyridoxal phosphate enzyme (YggS family)